MNKYIIKSSIVIIAVMFSQITSASPHKILLSYADLLGAVKNGDNVRAVMTLSKCIPSSHSVDNDNSALGGMDFTNFNKYQTVIDGQQKNIIATSTNIIVEHNQLGTIYDYVRLRVFEDNSAELFSEYLDPKTYTRLGSRSFHCHLSDGNDQNGIVLYDLS